MADLTRRTLLRAGGLLLVAPALVRASSLDMLPRAWSDGGWYRFMTVDRQPLPATFPVNDVALLYEFAGEPGFKPRGRGWVKSHGIRFDARAV